MLIGERVVSFAYFRKPCHFLLLLLLLNACATTEQNVGLGVTGLTLFVGNSPTSEIEQIYYLGVYDERNQLPPEFYRIKVHGQASFASNMKFGSGWVPANTIDTLSASSDSLSPDNVPAAAACQDSMSDFLDGRKLVLYGPEGFRKVPKCHRLVLVMGSDPSTFFEAIDSSLGVVSEARSKEFYSEVNTLLLQQQLKLQAELTRLEDLEEQL